MLAKTLVIVPALNEEAAIRDTLRELFRTNPELDLLVVDDGSVDRTSIAAREEGARVARLPFNLGVGGALRTGFRWAAANHYDQAVQFDADGQHLSEEIGKLLNGLGEGADLVIGSRFATEPVEYGVGRLRRGAMGLLRVSIRLLTGRRFTDTSSGFRAFSRSMIEFFAHSYPAEYLSDTVEAVLLAAYSGFEVAEVPVRMRARTSGRPSMRSIKLVYHYVRLLIVMGFTMSLKARKRGKGVAA